MRAKSKNKDKKRIRGVFLKLIFLVILGFSLWGIWGVTGPDNFPVKQVKIFATYEHVDPKFLQETIRSYLGNGFFYLNVIGLQRELLKFPWVYAASIKRKWPDTVVINIVEEQAILQWGSQALINSSGTIFTPSPVTFPENLPMIFGPENREEEIFSLYQKAGELFVPLGLNVRRLALNPHHYWEILFSSGTNAYLKEEKPLTQLKLLAELYKKITANRKDSPKSIDLRYHSGMAVKWE